MNREEDLATLTSWRLPSPIIESSVMLVHSGWKNGAPKRHPSLNSPIRFLQPRDKAHPR